VNFIHNKELPCRETSIKKTEKTSETTIKVETKVLTSLAKNKVGA